MFLVMFYSFQYKDTMQVWLNVFLSGFFCFFFFDVLMSDVWWGFPGGNNGKEPACQCRRPKRCRFNPWVRKIPWRRAWQPTPVFLPGESHGQRSLVGYRPWSCKELEITEATKHAYIDFPLNFISSYYLLVYRNAIDLFMLTSMLVNLLNSFFSSSSSFADSLGFYIYMIWLS